jgi:hypothetical protein
MVLFFPGSSRCALCFKVIEKGELIEGFPAFLNSAHKYGKFSDAVMHQSCYQNHSDHDAVADMYTAYCMIQDARPKELKTLGEIEAWNQEAFKDWPPKNGVVIFHPLSEDSEEGSFYMDADQYEAFCEAEDKAHKEMEERYEEAHRRECELRRYDRD